MSCQPLLLRLVFVYSDGIFTPRAPMPLHISAHLVRLIGRVPVNAAVRTFRVIEPNGLFDRFDYLLQAGKRLSVKEFVLDSIVDAFGHCIVSSYSFFFSSRISAFNAFISSAWLSTGSFFISSAILSFSDAKVRIILHTTDCAVSYLLANSLWLTPSR